MKKFLNNIIKFVHNLLTTEMSGDNIKSSGFDTSSVFMYNGTWKKVF